MPLYEEKLISPLAIRFTQNRIRSTFRDGRDVETTVKELTASSALGSGDHDIIIDAPFPAIEIIRWSPSGRKAGGGEHWFSFDNRRLYCLQRFAAECWPKRVAAKVEVLYADSGGIRKKLDTQTQGSSVFIGHAFATENELIEWSWRNAVQERAPPGVFMLESESHIAIDDAKTNLCDLTDVPIMSAYLPTEPMVPPGVFASIAIDGATTSLHDSADGPTGSSYLPAEAKAPPGVFASVAIDGATTSLHDLKALPQGEPWSPTETAKVEYQDDQLSALAIESESLTSLIGKLLTLNEDEHSKVRNTISSAASTCFSECSDIAESDDGMVESVISHGSSQHEAFALGSMSKDSIAQKTRERYFNQTWPGHVAPQAAQFPMSQYQMSQWQLAYAARMAQWQQATYAFHASHASIYR